MKTTIIFLLFTFSIAALNAQQIPVSLKWNNVQQESINSDTLFLLHFDDAAYQLSFGALPTFVYSKTIPTNEADNSVFNITLSNQEVEPLSTQNKKIEGLNNLSDHFKITHFISKSRGEAILEVHVLPIRKNNSGTIEALGTFQLNISSTLTLKTKSAQTNNYADHSVLSSGNWVKIAISESGIYKLTYSDITSMGLNPEKIRIFGNGGQMEEKIFNNKKHDDLAENAVWYELGSDGKFNNGDYLLFYGTGTDSWNFNSYKSKYEHIQHKFDNKAYYFLTSDVGVGKKIETAPVNAQAPNVESNAFDDFRFVEPEVKNLLKSGSLWLSDILYPNDEFEYAYNFPNIITSEKVTAELNAVARTTKQSSTFTLRYNDQLIGSAFMYNITSNTTGDFASMGNTIGSFYPNSDNITLKIKFSAYEASATGWFDYLRVTARRALIMEGNHMSFCDKKTIGVGNVTQFHISNVKENIKVLDVSDWVNPTEMAGTFSNNNFSFKTGTDELKKFVAFYPDGNFPKPEIVGNVANQDLHGAPQTDYLIVVHPSLRSQADRLAELHRAKGLSVLVVEPSLIYNEFSSGQRDITAIRWFAKLLYDKYQGDDQLKYLLLFGDGTYDNRITSTYKNPNLIPTYQSINSLNQSETYVSDDYFGFMDNGEGTAESGDRVDIGIGRLPVQNIQQATTVVNKIELYMSNKNCTPWKNSIAFIGDDEDSNRHMKDANILANKVMTEQPNMVVSKILFDAYQQVTLSSGPSYPDVNQLIDKTIEQGVVILNYSGHGGETNLSDEKVITMTGIKNYSNLNNLPLWVTATCEFSRFDLMDFTTAGEEVLLNNKGGGIGLFTTTRLVYSNANLEINRNFYNYAFRLNEDGTKNRLGDIFRLTKKVTGTGANKRKFSLLGDPALELANPTYKVITAELNGVPVENAIDSLKALSTITVSGFIEKNNGEIASDFNGFIYPQVYDKIVKKSTLANDEGSYKMDFNVWENILFSGKSKVENGEFSFTFKVPKDIDYAEGFGRIVYYATSEQNDAHGNFENLIVGGFDENQEEDVNGPDVSVFLNSTNFNNGDPVNPDPLMFANISDISGINKTGSSIGHDIVAILDNDPTTTVILNDYYEAGENYTEGVLKFKFQNLAEGEHTLFLRVWDNYNNSTSKTITFNVRNDIKPEIYDLISYPNPVSKEQGLVKFIFSQNRPDDVIQISINIFDLNGKLITSLTPAPTATNSQNIEPVEWDLRSPNGSPVAKGMYFYSVSITDAKQTSVSKTKKLIIR